MKLKSFTGLAAALCTLPIATAIDLDTSSTDSIKNAASTVAYNMMSYYSGNETGDTPGWLPEPYYWWEAGAMFSAMVDYWYFTNDTTYNDIVEQAMVHQAGDDRNYMPANASKSLGNDDQGFWGMTAMTAAETKFQDPPADQPQWLALAQAVFTTQMQRWDTATCGGGLHWQIFTFNPGYEYKNSISTGTMFNLASRLAVYTGNATYAEWAVKSWDWMESVGLLADEGHVYDGSDDLINCTEIDHLQWSYNAGIFLHGAANMYKYTNNSDMWLNRTSHLLTSLSDVFFYEDTGIMYEQACETIETCNVDQKSFKAFLSRWLAATSRLVPSLASTIKPLLETSAVAAAKQCNAGYYGASCGTKWFTGTNDGTNGVGQQMCALEVIQSLLVDQAPELVTNSTGGTSTGDYNAGGNTDTTVVAENKPITTADRAGAGILTALICLGVTFGIWFMVTADGWVG